MSNSLFEAVSTVFYRVYISNIYASTCSCSMLAPSMYHCADLFIFYSAELCNRALEVRERAPFLNGLFFFVIYVFNTHLFFLDF